MYRSTYPIRVLSQPQTNSGLCVMGKSNNTGDITQSTNTERALSDTMERGSYKEEAISMLFECPQLNGAKNDEQVTVLCDCLKKKKKKKERIFFWWGEGSFLFLLCVAHCTREIIKKGF